MQCNWLQIICLCAVIQFQFIIGYPSNGQQNHQLASATSGNGNNNNVWYPSNGQQNHQLASATSGNGNNNNVRNENPGAEHDGETTREPRRNTTKGNPADEQGNTMPRSTRHICTISTENYDCQFRDVHLKNGQLNIFGLEQNPQQRLTFQDSTLEYLPKSLIDAYPNVTLLNLNSLKITSIESNAFQNAANLQTMYLEDNRLINIDRDAFSGAKRLQTLVLSKNEISFFDYYAFGTNTDLQILYMDQNLLTNLPAFTNTASLQYLDASHNNIASIGDHHFSNLRNLETLDVSFNQLKRLNLQQLYSNLDLVNVSSNELTDFFMPPHVKELNARNNSLAKFIVGQQCELENLILAHNKLKIQPNLELCYTLEVLDLSNNLLETFKYKPAMARLKTLKLAHNNLFEIQLPIKSPSGQLSLKAFDLSHNRLSYFPSLTALEKLEWLSLNDNYLISLKSYADRRSHPNFKGYRMANNEWSCEEITKFEHLTFDKNATLCSPEMKDVNGICCRKYSKPYNDRLNQILRESDFIERANQKKCTKPVTASNNAMGGVNEIRKAIAKASSVNANKLREIENAKTNANTLQKQIEDLKMRRDSLHTSKRNVALEIEKHRQFHRVTKEGLISDKEMLERVVKFVGEKDKFTRGLLQSREQDTESSKGLHDEKQRELDELNQVISNLKEAQAGLKVEEKNKKKEKDLLEKKVNKNAANIHGGSGKISVQPRTMRHICTISTENYDCQFRDVHLKNGQLNIFGLEHNPQQRLTFQDSTLEYLPKSLIDAFPNVTLLNLNSLKITSIESNAFQNAANLQTMFLEDNRLINIDRDALSGAKRLQTLVLSKNEISLCDYYAFGTNTDLQILYMDQNLLTNLPAFTNTAYLQYLNASHNNIASIGDHHFNNLRNLKTLDVSFNELKRLNLQQLYSNLDLVDVSSNELTDFFMPPHVKDLNARNNSLAKFIVGQQCELENLILANNKLKIQPNLELCYTLEVLDLSNNFLETFKYKPSMARLKTLKLAHNNLFEIQLPIKSPSGRLSLKVFDLSHNKLSYFPSLTALKKLEWLSLDDNFFISLKSYADRRSHPNFKGYRMANNEWSCEEITKFEHLTVDKNATLCSKKMKDVNGICCRKYSKPYNDRLNQILRESDFIERANQKKCTKLVNAMGGIDEIRKAIAKASSENANKLREIENAKTNANTLQKQIEDLKMRRDSLHTSKRNVALEIEKFRQFHRVKKEELISDKEMLDRVVKFVGEKDKFTRGILQSSEQDTESSKGLHDEKQREIDELNQVISNLKEAQAGLKVEEKNKKKEKDLLQKKVNKNAAKIHGGSEKISVQ